MEDMADYSTDLLPLMGDDIPHFDVAMRGYDRRQVDAYVSRAEAEIAELQSARDSALATSADRAAQLASNAAHIESLKRQASKATEPITPSNVSDRIRDMLQLATEEASQTRRSAEMEADRVLAAARADAERVRAEAAAELQRLTAAAKQRTAEAEQKLAQARNQATAELERARSEATALLAAAAAERDRLDAEAAAVRDRADAEAAERRRMADEDFEITLRGRRRSAEREIASEQAQANAEAKQIVGNAREEVAELDAQRQRLYEELHELHSRIGSLVENADIS